MGGNKVSIALDAAIIVQICGDIVGDAKGITPHFPWQCQQMLLFWPLRGNKSLVWRRWICLNHLNDDQWQLVVINNGDTKVLSEGADMG